MASLNTDAQCGLRPPSAIPLTHSFFLYPHPHRLSEGDGKWPREPVCWRATHNTSQSPAASHPKYSGPGPDAPATKSPTKGSGVSCYLEAIVRARGGRSGGGDIIDKLDPGPWKAHISWVANADYTHPAPPYTPKADSALLPPQTPVLSTRLPNDAHLIRLSPLRRRTIRDPKRFSELIDSPDRSWWIDYEYDEESMIPRFNPGSGSGRRRTACERQWQREKNRRSDLYRAKVMDFFCFA
ncbi:hypothetical protein FB45DRAFT_947435 [Roridomyces roridus]|uniref:Uncharacterized protein n=1 Tax=Roridomyces roridus TaxID=1738132 RepID=A0AAD7B217_9AGAR|nr:hypothetical protein FB45DRAFT_947435 [Roridomyces roridus]